MTTTTWHRDALNPATYDVPGTVLYAAVTGSHAHGLATVDSDTDIRGVYAAPLHVLLGMNRDRAPRGTFTTHLPDRTFHELSAWCAAAADANPSVLEAFFSPHTAVFHPAGQILVNARDMFLTTRARTSYPGAATSMARDAAADQVPRRARKTALHALRIAYTGRDLLVTGRLTVDVSGYADELVWAADRFLTDPAWFAAEIDRVNQITAIVDTPLPDRADWDTIDDLIVTQRLNIVDPAH